MKKVGLYGGTFDPVHVGHLNLACELMEKGGLDEVWFIPAHVNPHKMDCQPTCIKYRKKMLKLAIQEIPNFKLKDLESRRPPPSYTIDTLRMLLAKEAQHPVHQFYLLMGEDTISNFFHWYQPKEIVKLVPLLIGSRALVYQNDIPINGDKTIKEAIRKGLVQTRLMDVSGTELRKRLKQKLYCGHLILADVLAYIHEKHLYQ